MGFLDLFSWLLRVLAHILVARNVAKFGCVFSYFYDSVAAYSNLNVGKPGLISFHSAIAAYSKLIEM